MLSIIKNIILFTCLVLWSTLNSQITTEQEVIQRALDRYPSIQIAHLYIEENKARERTAFNPSQPQFAIEFPANFGLGFEVEQEFDFPTVYSKRSKWLKSQTRRATEAASITQRELIRDIRMDYLEAQHLQARIRNYTTQDSLWKEIADKSKRLFEGGEINKADFLFAERQASFIHFTLLNTSVELSNLLVKLSGYTGDIVLQLQELQRLPHTSVDTMSDLYFEKYLAASLQVAEYKSEVLRAERWPDLMIGYLKVDDFDTDFRYRYKAGITVPIWQGQYQGEIEASKVEIEKIQAETELEIREAKLMQIQWRNKLLQTIRSLEWFETTALPQMDELVATYLRLYEAGEVDFALTLRNIADALSTRSQYLETLKQHNESVIQLEFLNSAN